jgi:hypothetical protein
MGRCFSLVVFVFLDVFLDVFLGLTIDTIARKPQHDKASGRLRA